MDMMKIAAVSLLGAVALLIFKQYKPEWAVPTRLTAGVIMMALCLVGVGEIISFAEGLAAEGSMPSEVWRLILKGFGIAFITELASGICRDSGEASLSLWVETAGKITLLMLALPLIRDVMEAVKNLLGVGG